MKLRHAAFALVAGAGIAIQSIGTSFAQDVSAEHLRAARTAVDAIGITDEFDAILPQAAMMLKAELTQQNPDRERLISTTVDEQAISLAARRADLENEVAALYAQVFSQEELEQISGFYGSPTGRKFLETHPQVTGQAFQAANIWQAGISRDLTQAVTTQLRDQIQPAEGAAPQ